MKPLLLFLLSLFLVFASADAFAQQEFMLNGVLFENGSKLRIALAEISNSRNHYSVGSNDMGLFQIRAIIGDTLTISKRGFDDKVIVLRDTKDLVLYLSRGNTLSEVVINGQGKKQELNDMKKEFRNKGSFYAGKPPILSYFLSPLTAFYELFGRTPRNARRFNNMYVTEMQESQVDQLFNKSIIHQLTGLDGKELEDFMINYRPDYEKAKNWTQYDGNKWIMDSFKKYKEKVITPIK